MNNFFFFQAEDGIRDRNVTGVQTCALPIWEVPSGRARLAESTSLDRLVPQGPGPRLRAGPARTCRLGFAAISCRGRSEERRVGKEWRCRGSGAPVKKEADRALREGGAIRTI